MKRKFKIKYSTIYGFTKYIKTQRMEYPNGESKEIEYYLK